MRNNNNDNDNDNNNNNNNKKKKKTISRTKTEQKKKKYCLGGRKENSVKKFCKYLKSRARIAKIRTEKKKIIITKKK